MDNTEKKTLAGISFSSELILTIGAQRSKALINI